MLRSQSGPLAGVPFSTVPRNFDTRLEPHLFRVLLLRRLRLPLPPTVHLCRCGRHQDSFGHHRATCAQGGGWPQQPRCVERLAHGSHPTSWSAIWTCLHRGKHLMAEDWKLWPKAFQSLGACRRRSTRRWSVHSTATERPDTVQRYGTAWPSTQHVDARSGHAQNWWVHIPGLDWLSSRVKLEGGGPQKRPCFCVSSQKPKPGRNRPFCA